MSLTQDLTIIILVISCPIILLLYKRRRARLLLSSHPCNLPTISWMPKFINYTPKDVSSKKPKLASSSITNILPRMERLKGPYGIYATVYGISTKVIHIAHPIPAKIVLGSSNLPIKHKQNNVTISESLGAVKSPVYDHFLNMFGRGVFTADGQDWKNKRSSVLHCLLRGVTKDDSDESIRLEREANYAATAFLKSWKRLRSNNGGGDRGSIVNVVPLLQRAMIGFIYRFLTHDEVRMEEYLSELGESKENIDFHSNDTHDDCSTASDSSSSHHQGESQKDRIQHTDKMPPKSAFSFLSTYLEAVTNIRMIILAQSRSIWYILPGWMYKVFSPMYRDEQRQLRTIREFARQSCLSSKPGSPLYMLRSRLSHNPNMEKEIRDGNKLSQELMDEAITLLFAGQDTSAATLSWTLHLLSLNPKAQDRLAKEVHSFMTEETNVLLGVESPYISKKTALKMTYLDAVIKESMRLYPVAPFVVRKVPHDLYLGESGNDEKEITVPKDTFACVWTYSLHRNPKLWHRPDDFVPERWIDPDLQQLDDGQTKFPGTFMPFATGPRNCVGQPLAHVILRIILARIINDTQVIDEGLKKDNALPSEDIMRLSMDLRKDMQAGFTVLPSEGVWLDVLEGEN